MKGFDLIYVDPPWSYKDTCSAGKRGAVHKYPVMSLENIISLPIWKLASDNCLCATWGTWPQLPIVCQALEGWGFTYKSVGFVWVKTTKNKKLHWGMGNWTRANSEFVLLGVRGKPKRVDKAIHSIVHYPISKTHSQKPNVIRKKLARLVGNPERKIELFATEKVPGWRCTGFEVDGRDIRDVLKRIK